MYINDLAKVFGNNHKTVLYAYSTSLIVTHLNHTDFSKEITSALNQLNKWFAANLLSLNVKKTQYVQFMTKSTSVNEICIGYNNTFITNTSNTEFLGLVITNSVTWNDHVTQLILKLSKACYVLRCIRPFMSQDALKSVYYSYFHSLITYSIILGVILYTVLLSFDFRRRQLE